MTSEQYDKMYELARRLSNFGDTKVKCDVDLTDDYFNVSEFNPSEGFVTITKSDGDFLAEFPISSLADSIIADILYDAEQNINSEEDDIDKVLDQNYYATL